MDSWDDDGASKKVNSFAPSNQWEGEDEDDVLDSWDQEPEEVKEEPVKTMTTTKRKDKYEEKDKVKKKEQEFTIEDEPIQELTAEEKIAEKLRQQKLQEESDLSLAKEMFGGSLLESKEDFEQFREEIVKKLNECSKNSNFVNFAEQVVQALCVHLSSADLKKVHNSIGNLHIEKMKMEKGEKGKKHKHKIKAKLKVDDETDYNEYSAYTETDDFGDFM